MKKYINLFLLILVLPVYSYGCPLWSWIFGSSDKTPVIPPRTEQVEKDLKAYKDKVQDNNQVIVAESKGIKVLADNKDKPGVPDAIKDSADIIIKRAGGDTTADKEKTVMERMIAATQGLNEQYHTLYTSAMNDSDKKIKALTETNDKLTGSLANAKADYEAKIESVKLKAATDLEKQKQADKQKTIDDAAAAEKQAAKDTLTLCIFIASVSSLIAIGLIIARFYLSSIIPARAPFIFFGIAAAVMAYAILAGQWWFPYVLGVAFIIGLAEVYKYFKSVTNHLISVAQYTKLSFELVAGVQKYIKEHNITDEQKKASPIFIELSKALSPESKVVVEQIKSEYAAKNIK